MGSFVPQCSMQFRQMEISAQLRLASQTEMVFS